MFCLIVTRVLDFICKYFLPSGFLNSYSSAPTARSKGLDLKGTQRFREEPNLVLPGGQPCVGPNQVAEHYEKV